MFRITTQEDCSSLLIVLLLNILNQITQVFRCHVCVLVFTSSAHSCLLFSLLTVNQCNHHDDFCCQAMHFCHCCHCNHHDFYYFTSIGNHYCNHCEQFLLSYFHCQAAEIYWSMQLHNSFKYCHQKVRVITVYCFWKSMPSVMCHELIIMFLSV